MPKIKTVRTSEPIIKEWESDSEDDEIVVKPKEVTKTAKPSFENIEYVNARNKTVRQTENPRKNNKNFVFELIVHWKQQVEEEGLVTRGLLFWELIKAAGILTKVETKSKKKLCYALEELSCTSDVENKSGIHTIRPRFYSIDAKKKKLDTPDHTIRALKK
ncbi:hypothetical protein Tco_1063242 [Tanacetum coccineum]